MRVLLSGGGLDSLALYGLYEYQAPHLDLVLVGNYGQAAYAAELKAHELARQQLHAYRSATGRISSSPWFMPVKTIDATSLVTGLNPNLNPQEHPLFARGFEWEWDEKVEAVVHGRNMALIMQAAAAIEGEIAQSETRLKLTFGENASTHPSTVTLITGFGHTLERDSAFFDTSEKFCFAMEEALTRSLPRQYCIETLDDYVEGLNKTGTPVHDYASLYRSLPLESILAMKGHASCYRSKYVNSGRMWYCGRCSHCKAPKLAAYNKELESREKAIDFHLP